MIIDHRTEALPTIRLTPDTAPTDSLPHVNTRKIRIDPYALDLFGVAARFVICLDAIYVGIHIAVSSNNGVAVLAAFGCAAIIYGLLKPMRRIDTTTNKIYHIKIGPLIWRLYGDSAFDTWHGGHDED